MKQEPAPPGKRTLSRRKWLLGLGACAAGGVTSAVVLDDRWDLQTSHVTVELHGLGRDFDGFRIGHLTDLHRGRYVPATFIERAVEALNAERPDLIVLTGDCITRKREMIASCAQALAKLSAPHGKLAVLGNHDYWVDAEGVSRALTETAGFQVLRNESATLMVGESVLTVVGLDDPYTHHGDFAQAMSGIPGGSPTVLLAHDPDIIEQAAARGISLVLAGHTHGGQVVVPGLGPPIPNSRYGQRYVSGLNHCGATAIYTNRGIGMVLVPLRIACPPEVAVIALRPEAISATRLPGRSPARRQPSGR